MTKLSYAKALNRALADELARDPAVCVFGEDVGAGLSGLTPGLQARFGADRVVDTPLSEQAFTSLALGAALTGMRPVVEFQIPSLLFLVFEQIANQAHKISLMTGGQIAAPVTYVVPGSGSRDGWAGQHSDHPYSLFAHVGVKTLLPATPTDAYGLLVSAIRDPDPVVLFAPAGALGVREDVTTELAPVPIGSARIHRPGEDVTVVAAGHLVHDALAVAEELAGEISVEVFDPRSLYPFDWPALAASLARTGRLVVIDDSNRMCGLGAEVIATVAEQGHRLRALPRRITRPDGAVLPFALGLDRAVQPGRAQLRDAVRAVLS
ncbi:pyruvate/2-oxoglutarate/acetoin dehydrogenase E1 component [Kitasatospora sp. MAP12-15]|uniref:alpha-ketoacid dehydrogenase subunit beta n=1 Tax=unclassified Kitasatospora TaxID=2633591 RepID=UPI0024750D8C|nr:transketolase C-terminal domain-containing protein [Kitasatospora sp. MAP12-44]MDH6109404.1 pyruvate/2-oxoglutarate/acetoin dehydrogenase E1 component [Kitasatospora sp. MAP12-44]